MIDHLGINCADLDAAAAFYDRVLGALGHRRLLEYPGAIGYGTEHPAFWLGTFDGVGANREVHVGFTAADAESVRAFFAAAVEAGAQVLHEPRLWPEYHPDYFGAFVRDPDGNNVEACSHRGE